MPIPAGSASCGGRVSGSRPAGRARLFPPQDLGFLDAPDREQWGKPELILDELSIADGAVVAELGAGGGWFTVRLATRVGPNGIVYAEDIQPEMIEVIRRRVQNERLPNVVPILGTPSDPRLPGGLDAALIVDTYRRDSRIRDRASPERRGARSSRRARSASSTLLPAAVVRGLMPKNGWIQTSSSRRRQRPA